MSAPPDDSLRGAGWFIFWCLVALTAMVAVARSCGRSTEVILIDEPDTPAIAASTLRCDVLPDPVLRKPTGKYEYRLNPKDRRRVEGGTV